MDDIKTPDPAADAAPVDAPPADETVAPAPDGGAFRMLASLGAPPAPTPSDPVPARVLPAPEPTPAAPEPTPAAPEPTPAAPEPTPAAPEPTPTAPEPTPTAPTLSVPVAPLPSASIECQVLALGTLPYRGRPYIDTVTLQPVLDGQPVGVPLMLPINSDELIPALRKATSARLILVLDP